MDGGVNIQLHSFKTTGAGCGEVSRAVQREWMTMRVKVAEIELIVGAKMIQVVMMMMEVGWNAEAL